MFGLAKWTFLLGALDSWGQLFEGCELTIFNQSLKALH
jgi:hypothetical protein